MDGMPATTSADLWRQLLERGDLQDTGRDRDLVGELGERLGLPAGVEMMQALAAVPVERLVAEFFQLAEPFAAMWRDLLILFERAAATTGSDQLEIRYNFGALEPNVGFSLESFRRLVEHVEELMSPFDLRAVQVHMLWDIYEAFGAGSRQDAGPQEWPEVLAAAESLRRKPFPAALPPRPRSLDGRLDDLLNQTWLLAEVVLRDLRLVFGSHDGYRQDAPGMAPSGMPIEVLQFIEGDYWLASLIEAVARAAGTASRTELPSQAGGGARPVTLADRLDGALEPLRNTDPSLRNPQRRLTELLSLPLWQHRYDLYSSWVTARIIAALEDTDPIIHSARGSIEFAFSGTHLATFDRLHPRAHLWCEYRTSLAKPSGKRKGHIQPDITLRIDPLTAGLSLLVVECKQYAAADSDAFAKALADYARGHPDATVVLVNYGPGRESTVLERVPTELQARIMYLPLLRPGSAAALERFAEAIRRAVVPLAPEQPRAGSEPVTAADELHTITLRWNHAPNDLDLHLLIGERWDVGFQSTGSLHAEPYARLVEDVRHPGSAEIVQIARWLPLTYHVQVVNYSHELPLAAARPTVEVTIGGQTRVFDCPPNAPSDQWRVCTIDGRSGTITSG